MRPRLLTVSLAAASLALVGCAKPGLQAVPIAPWDVPSETAAPVNPAVSSAPQPETTTETEGTVPGVAETPAATEPPTASAPTSAATQTPAPQATQATGSATPRATTRATAEPTTKATPKATMKASAQPTRPAARPASQVLLGRGADGDRVRDVQARLKQLHQFSGEVTGYYGAVTAAAVANYQTKQGLQSTGAVDQATLTALSSHTRTPSKAELGLETTAGKAPTTPPGQTSGIDPRCLTGRALCISKRTNTMKWVIDGQVQQTMAVRFGTKELPTREGSFSVGWKSRNHVSTLYHTPMPYAMFFSGGQAVHFSPDFASRGYSGGSHGCVNVRDKAGIQSLFNQVRVGDKVIVHR